MTKLLSRRMGARCSADAPTGKDVSVFQYPAKQLTGKKARCEAESIEVDRIRGYTRDRTKLPQYP